MTVISYYYHYYIGIYVCLPVHLYSPFHLQSIILSSLLINLLHLIIYLIIKVSI